MAADDLGHAGRQDTLAYLAEALDLVTSRPERLPTAIADRVHELLLQLDSAGLAPPAPLSPSSDEASERLPLESGRRAPVVGSRTAVLARRHWRWQGHLPVDTAAERTLVGIALVSQGAAGEVRQSVPDSAWHEPRHRRIVAAAAEVGDLPGETSGEWALRVVPPGRALDVTDLECCGRRVTAIAAVTGEERVGLVSFITGRAQLHDGHADLAARVIVAAQGREDIEAHIGALEGLGLSVTAEAPPAGDEHRGSKVREHLSGYAAGRAGAVGVASSYVTISHAPGEQQSCSP
jgi:hypothetical protein